MIDRAQQVADHDLDLSINSELELIELADLEALIGVEKTMLLNKLSNGEIADELFAFRKSKVLSYVEQKGVTYFSRRNARRGRCARWRISCRSTSARCSTSSARSTPTISRSSSRISTIARWPTSCSP